MSSSQPAMLTKFETLSSRVKGVAFHPQRPWILCGLHNGVVQIWDYRMRTCVDRYEEHTGPVRGVDFHQSQPLFVTGSDDHTVRVWNYKLKRCLFVLHGHLDFVRTVQFHKHQPWIVSASDDYTIRIWNWQNRSYYTALTGHNHYVMSAQFHPREDLLVSASTDTTIRVWDISALRVKKTDSSLPNDLFGNTDAVVKFILEGHEKSVNWASFHPDKNLIVSGSEDRSVRLWRMDDSRCIEVDAFRGHTNIVSCVTFFRDQIISCGEDRTIRVWDTNSRTPTFTFRREADRFWVLAVQPEQNLIAAGHDNGMFIFKLQRERPAFTIANNVLYWVKDQQVRTYDFATKTESCPMNLRRHNFPPISMSCNPGDSSAAFWYESDNGFFELCTIPKPGQAANQDIKKGLHFTSAVFFSAGKFATLDRSNQILIRSSNNDLSKPLPPVGNANRIFPGPSGFILLRGPDNVYLFHVAQKSVVAEIQISGVRYAVWDKDFNRLALLTKNSIQVCTRRLKPITTIFESTVRVKSAAFDEDRDVLLFTTSNHLKYCNLRNGECGTIRTTDNVIYLVRAAGNAVWYLTRQGKVVLEETDNTELAFKLALQQERFRDVLKIIQSKKLQGQALVAYLEKNNHPEIAMHFVADPWIRFNLAVESGAMDIAKASANEMNNPDAWRILSETATRFGDVQLAMLANSKINNASGLAHQCLITGNMPTMQALIDKSRDPHFVMQYSLFTGDVDKRIGILAQSGQLPLAYSLAKSNGREEACEQLLAAMKPEVAERCLALKVGPAMPVPAVEAVQDNWPALPVQESYFSRMLKEPGLLDYVPEAQEATGGAWMDDDDDLFGDEGGAKADDDGLGGYGDDAPAPTSGGGGAWDDDDLDLDLGDDTSAGAAAAPSSASAFVLPREGESLPKHWVDHSQLPAHHVAAGSFQTAIALLRKQVGLVDAAPLQSLFLSMWAAANASLPTWSLLPSHAFALATRPADDDLESKHAPLLPKTLASLSERITHGYQATQEGRFGDAIAIFTQVLYGCLLCVVDDKKQLAELQAVMAVAREYVTAFAIDSLRKAGTADEKRNIELAIYFTHCKLQNSHVVLGLNQAMVRAFKGRCFKTAGILARRILDLDPAQDVALKARKVIDEATAKGNTDAMNINYDDRNPFALCGTDFVPMYRGTVETIRCPFCFAPAHPQHKGKTCNICKIAKLGESSIGQVNGVFQTN